MPVPSLAPDRTALVVVDLQHGLVGREFAPHPADTVLENALQLAEAFRAVGGLVVLVRTEPTDAEAQPVDVGRPGRQPALGEIVEELVPLGDLTVVKHTWGAFHGTQLDAELRTRGIHTVVLVGLATNLGVESTARAAHEHGYAVVTVADATSSLDTAMHEFAVDRVFPLFSRVTTTTAAIAALSTG